VVIGHGRKVAQLLGELPRFVREAVRETSADVDPSGDLDAEGEQTARALMDLGLDEDAARVAVLDDRVPLALAEQVLGEPPRYTLEEIAKHTGVPAELLREVRIASGLPLPERFTRADLTYARRLGKLLEVLSPEAVVRAARTRGTVLATVARSDLGTVHDQLVQPMRQAGADDLSVAVSMAEAAKQLEGLARDVDATGRLLVGGEPLAG
jgi:hypothetical protein